MAAILTPFVLALLSIFPATVTAQTNGLKYDEKEALAISQAAIGGTIGAHTLLTRDGTRVALQSLRGRPLVISMIFTSCFHTCPVLTQNLATVVSVARDALGADSFDVLTIGFDTANDTPEQMSRFAADSGITDDRWQFLSADPKTVHSLSKELGFIYFASPRGFDHLTQTTVIDATGRVYRQIYGQRLEPPALVEPLKELIFNSPREAGFIDQWVNKIQLFCTVYDKDAGRYVFDSSIFVAIGVGLVCLSAIAGFIIQQWRHAR